LLTILSRAIIFTRLLKRVLFQILKYGFSDGIVIK